jgi:AcrR family transcriptional regulator
LPSDTARAKRGQDRREAILDAALDVFSAQGYAAARLDDVAARAGVAKGTLYLHFRSKQDLFEQLVTHAVKPVLEGAGQLAGDPGGRPTREIVAALHALFRREVLGTRRREVLRLVLAEGPRFPAIAAFYHREVVSRGLALVRRLAERAVARGEIATDAVARFPHLVFAPLLLAVLWDGLFSQLEPLDVEGLLEAQRNLVFPEPPPRKETAP